MSALPPIARALALTASLALLLGSAACDQTANPAKPATLKAIDILIDWQAEPTYLGIYYAKHQGYFEKAGYAATITQSWGANEAVAAVASGRYLLGTASGGATVLGRNNGANVVSTAVLYPRIPTVIYGLSATNVRTPADLKGKRIGIYPGSITSNEFDAFLKVNGLDRSDLTIVSLSGADIPLLLSGRVDAVLHYTEMSPVQVETAATGIPGEQGARTFELRLADLGVGGYGLNVIANEGAWRNQRPQLEALTQAIEDGYRDGCAHRQEAVAAFVAEFPDKDPVYVRQSWDRVCLMVGATPGAQTAQGWADTIGLYRGLGLLQADVTPAQILGQ